MLQSIFGIKLEIKFVFALIHWKIIFSSAMQILIILQNLFVFELDVMKYKKYTLAFCFFKK